MKLKYVVGLAFDHFFRINVVVFFKGIGCYMFRIDEQDVVDATRKGNQARFINHSCEPNCISKVLIIQGHKHIVIFAQRFIHKGEELTYDYKFPKEDVKISCLCKSLKCRKYLN
jgi:SET domain-containing protein